MREFAIYDPEEFGMYGSPAGDEAYVILKDIHTNKTYLTYIMTEDIDAPPVIDLDSMEEIVIDLEDRSPVISHISMRKDGTVMMDNAEKIVLSEKQSEILAYPSTLYTMQGRMVTLDNESGTTVFERDMTLEGIPSVKLDYMRATKAIKDKYPDLLMSTHERYGNKYPYFPFAKYYDTMDKAVVFMTKEQVMNLNPYILRGEIPFYQNFFLAEKWDINNTYGVCIIDEKDYNLRLISPKSLGQYISQEKTKREDIER